MRILVTSPYNAGGLEELNQFVGETVYKPWKDNGRAFNEDELIQLLTEAQAEALITEHDHVTEKVIAAFPDLKFIGVCRGTPSNVAIKTASAYKIPVFYTPARNAQAVAELFVANVVNVLRDTLYANQWLKEGKWDEGAHTSYLIFKGNELAGKKVGFVGFGAIGQLIARMIVDYPCDIAFYDPYVSAEDFPGFEKLELDELFASADIVSVHLPVTEETKGLISRDLFVKMKADALFVNTARAVVVDREALLEVIEQKKIKGAILDVFDNEPPDELDYKLIRSANVLATPHIAGATHEVEDHHVRIMNESLKAWMQSGEVNPKRIANRQIFATV
jgi:D-3-phosphoglycerate dehydrogenase